MRTLTLNVYQLVNGELHLVDGEPVIVDTIELEYDPATTAVAGSVGHVPHLYSFDVLWSETRSEWRLFINKRRLIGRYSTRPQALGALVGLFTRLGSNSPETLTTVISDRLYKGSVIQIDSVPVKPLSTAYYSYGKSPDDGLNSFYYSDAEDVSNGETPDLDFSGVIAQMNNGNANLVMIYPDSGGNGTISTSASKSWKSFNLEDIGTRGDANFNPGYDPTDGSTWAVPFSQRFPQMDPQDFVDSVNYYINKDPQFIDDPASKAFCFDWEGQFLTTSSLGSLYWNDTANPKYKEAMTELRNQQQAIYDALKAEFPDSYFGMYNGTASVGQSQARFTSGGNLSATGTPVRWYGLLSVTQRQSVQEVYEDALAQSAQPWDYVTAVCYDAFAPGSIQLFEDYPAADSTALTPLLRKQEYQWAINTMKAHLSVPCLAIVSPSNIAVNALGTDPTATNPPPIPWPDGNYNNKNPYILIDEYSWITQTIDFIKEADGYLVWDGLRIDQTRQFMSNYVNWADIVTRDTNAGNTKIQDQMNKWFSLLADLETRFGTLTTIANNYSVPVPVDAEDWFNLDRTTIRNTNFVRNVLSKDTIQTIETMHIPLIEEWRTTGLVPYIIEGPATMTGNTSVAGTLSITTDFVGDLDVEYKWAYVGSSSTLGTDSTYVVQPADAGQTLRCRVRYLRDDVQVEPQEWVVYPDVVPPYVAPAGTITQTFGPFVGALLNFNRSAMGLFASTDFPESTIVQPFITPSSGPAPVISISIPGVIASEILVNTGDQLTFTYPDNTTGSTPITVMGTSITIVPNAATDLLLTLPVNSEIGMAIT